jgi:L-ascorbate metabolism protein UlaG (beta-lactamase superfamily)
VIQATFLGTGAAFSRRFGHTNALVEAGAVRLMIDFGFLAPARLEALDRSLDEITHIAVSHIHADHVGGLEEMAFVSRFTYEVRPTLVLPEAIADDLWSTCLRGGLEWTADEQGDAEQCTLDSYFDSIRLDGGWADLGGVEIKAFANDHVPGKATYGLIVREAGTSNQMIFGCDVRNRISELEAEPLPEDFRHGPIFHDVQLFDTGQTGVHIHFDQILDYPESVRERIILVHYNESIDDCLPRIRRAGLKIAWPGTVVRVPGWQEGLRERRRRAAIGGGSSG